MSLPTNLFIDTPEVEDASLQQLSNDADTWPEDIIQKVKERIPSSKNLNMMFKVMKKDEENGVATGSVTIHSADKAVVVPVIIKDFMMHPMDIMIANGKLVPLTPDYFDAVFSKNDMFDKLEEYPTFGGLGRFEDANLWNSIYPPSLGRYAYASSGAYDILNSISDTIDGSSLKAFLMDPKNEKVASRLLSGPHKDVIKKLANYQPVNMNEYRQGVENLIPRSVVMVKAESPNKYSILSNSDSVFHPAINKADRAQVIKFMSSLSDNVQDDINEVDQNGEKMLSMPEPKNDVILAKEDTEIPEEATEYDHYSVKSKTGLSVEGVVIPRVIDFGMRTTGDKLFVGKTMSSYQPSVWGVRIKNSRFQPKVYDVPATGQTGCFIYQPDKSHALATIPVTIELYVDGGLGDRRYVKATDLTGGPVTLVLEDGGDPLEAQQIIKMGPRKYRLPRKMRWLPLDVFHEVSNSPVDYSVKQAAHVITDKPVTLISTGYDQYALRGVQKYASALKWDASNLLSYQAKFLLASLGCGQEKIASAFKVANLKGSAELHGLNFTPLAVEKVAAAKPLADKMKKFAEGLRSNLIKEASYLENSQTVDALLSLNFVTPTNVSKFISKIPSLKSAVSNLASCLIASRLGIKEIPEQSASSAMLRLVEVIDGLERLKAMQTVGV